MHLLPPAGRIEARDGRRFVLDDPAALVADFNARGVDLAVDFEHQSENETAKQSGPVPAAGWVRELRAGDTGLCALVDWTARAAAMIGAKEYRYLSPAFLHDKAGRITRLKSVGLVHQPALQLTALASEEDTMPPEPMLARLVKALGLPEGATEDDALAAGSLCVARLVDTLAKVAGKPGEGAAALASEATPDPARFVPVETVKAMLAERNAAVATMSEERATAKVEDALRKGHLSPAMKPWAVALCRSDEAAFDAFLSSVPPAFAHLSDRFATAHLRGPVRDGTAPEIADTARSICDQLGLKPEALER